jgi:hypothetical protein
MSRRRCTKKAIGRENEREAIDIHYNNVHVEKAISFQLEYYSENMGALVSVL